MPLTVPIPLALGRFSRLPQRTHEVWQGGLVRLPMWIDHPTDPTGLPYRPTGAVWVSLRTGLMHLAIPPERSPASAEFALGALIEFGMKWAKELAGRPSHVEVRDPALRDALAASLDSLSTRVVLVDELPAVREVLANLEASTSGSERIPGLLELPGITPERLRAFAEAASSFYQARPWQHLANDDLIVVDADSAPKGMRHISVLGHGGQQFGLAFFDSRRAFERMVHPKGRGGAPTRAFGVTFGTIDELPFADGDAWEDYTLPVASTFAYPLAADLHRDGRVGRPGARELTYSEALLRALATTSEDELDSGRWEKQVQTFDGVVTLAMTLPLLVYDAMESEGRLRLKRAREALAISPDCADAWAVLAEDAPDTETALERYEQAAAAGARAIGSERFDALAGEFWGHLETRPYMRARLGLAQCLEGAGRGAESVAHYRELLRLNPGDNQGVRYLLVVALLKQNRDEEAGALLDTHPDEGQALWPYARALWSFRTSGATAASRGALEHAVRVNPHALTYLLDPDSVPVNRPPYFGFGSREEAAYVEEELGDLYDATPDALEWLRTEQPSVRRGSRTRRSPRKSSGRKTRGER